MAISLRMLIPIICGIMPWDSVDKWRDEDHWPQRGRRKGEEEGTVDSIGSGVQDLSNDGVRPNKRRSTDVPFSQEGEEV